MASQGAQTNSATPSAETVAMALVNNDRASHGRAVVVEAAEEIRPRCVGEKTLRRRAADEVPRGESARECRPALRKRAARERVDAREGAAADRGRGVRETVAVVEADQRSHGDAQRQRFVTAS